MTRILAIETSCDETAISILEFSEKGGGVSGKVLSHIVSSQVALHAPFGGVVPNIAKREHQRNLIPLLKQALSEAGLLNELRITDYGLIRNSQFEIDSILNREPELLVHCKEFLPTIAAPEIDLIAVTHGPGLEPALWVGINFAKALATIWQKPLIPVSHMEGHLFSALLKKDSDTSTFNLQPTTYPAVGLLISGGHTELIEITAPLSYTLLGQTRDDAVGEAFDKVARLLDLPYPGGPQISMLAQKFDPSTFNLQPVTLPRPMINSDDLDFSFSGIKTAVRYMIDKLPKPLTEETKIAIAHEFEEAVTEVIVAKTRRALEQTGARELLVGGGVIANKRIRKELAKMCQEAGVALHLPENWLTGDNATMIAAAAYFRSQNTKNLFSSSQAFTHRLDELKANGTLRLSTSEKP